MRRHLVGRVVLDEPVIERLVGQTLDGDERAREALWLALGSVIEKVAGRWRVSGRLHDREDHRRDVVVGVMERLEANHFQRMETLHALLERRDGTASAWFGVLTVRAAIRRTEAHADHLGHPGAEGGSRWADLVPFEDGLEEDLPPESLRMIEAITAHEVMACGERTLSRLQLDALRLWAADQSNEKIAEALQLPGAEAAAKLVHAAQGRLRARFTKESVGRLGAPRNISRVA